MKLGAALSWHTLPWEELLALVRKAEALGYAAVYVDGDVSMLGQRRERDVLDGWTLTTALLARTQRIGVGSMRLPHHWNAARLAQSVATLERLDPGRLRFLISVGDRPIDARFGLPLLSVGDRIAWLDELLSAVRALWRGEAVTLDGRFVTLAGATVRPAPIEVPIEIAARGKRMLELVAAHADAWEVNLPPLVGRVRRAAAHLEAACRQRGRDPGEISRSLWIFTRLGKSSDLDAQLAEYRRVNPWFGDVPDGEIRPCLVVGGAAECRERLASLAAELHLELPVVDLSGLPARPAEELLEALAEDDFLR